MPIFLPGVCAAVLAPSYIFLVSVILLSRFLFFLIECVFNEFLLGDIEVREFQLLHDLSVNERVLFVAA